MSKSKNEYLRQYYLKNIDRLKAARKEYYFKNKKKISKKRKMYYKNNKDKIKKYQKNIDWKMQTR